MTPEHTITPTLKELTEELARVKTENDTLVEANKLVSDALVELGHKYTALREKLNDIAQGNVETGVITNALLESGKLAFQERMFSWCQETARKALEDSK
jgi:hypothetical protein